VGNGGEYSFHVHSVFVYISLEMTTVGIMYWSKDEGGEIVTLSLKGYQKTLSSSKCLIRIPLFYY
jgi:hypothetical protein